MLTQLYKKQFELNLNLLQYVNTRLKYCNHKYVKFILNHLHFYTVTTESYIVVSLDSEITHIYYNIHIPNLF